MATLRDFLLALNGAFLGVNCHIALLGTSASPILTGASIMGSASCILFMLVVGGPRRFHE